MVEVFSGGGAPWTLTGFKCCTSRPSTCWRRSFRWVPTLSLSTEWVTRGQDGGLLPSAGQPHSVRPRQPGGKSAFTPMSSLPSCSPVTEETLGLLTQNANMQSISVLGGKLAGPLCSTSSCRREHLTIVWNMWHICVFGTEQSEYVLVYYTDASLPSSVSIQVHRWMINSGHKQVQRASVQT